MASASSAICCVRPIPQPHCWVALVGSSRKSQRVSAGPTHLMKIQAHGEQQMVLGQSPVGTVFSVCLWSSDVLGTSADSS